MKKLILLFIMSLFIMTHDSMETDLIIDPSSKSPNRMSKEMPADFDFIVRYGSGRVTQNKINTYQDIVTKDLISKGTATANISFSIEEMRSIYEKMREINVMELTELVPQQNNCQRTPFNEDSWKISLAGDTRTFTWSDQHCDVTSDAQQLLDLRRFIQKIVVDKEAYKKLPPTEGGYD